MTTLYIINFYATTKIIYLNNINIRKYGNNVIFKGQKRICYIP